MEKKKEDRFCSICGRRLAWNQVSCCSNTCRLALKESKKTIKFCKQCGKQLGPKDYQKQFCNGSCAATYNNLAKGRDRMVEAVCPICGKKFTTLPHKRRVSCSSECALVLRSHRVASLIKSGEFTYQGGGSVPQSVRRYIMQKYGSKCTKCGWHEVNPKTGKTPLHVDHIDGNSQNYKEENLDLLCPNCHSLTPTYGSLNKGNGRDSIKKRIKGLV